MEYLTIETTLTCDQIEQNIKNHIDSDLQLNSKGVYNELRGFVSKNDFKLHERTSVLMREHNNLTINGVIIDESKLRKVKISISINSFNIIFFYIFLCSIFFIDISNVYIKLTAFIAICVLVTWIIFKINKKRYKYYQELIFSWIFSDYLSK